ncbi:MAG: zinc-binding dehydrogenase [Limisphaerales bacterium]
MSTARVAIFHGPGEPFTLSERLLPAALEPGQVLAAISLATVCGSDLHTVAGRRREPAPAVLGHEAVGRVLAVGAGRDPALVGRRVSWTLADSCGACPACREWALPQKCARLFKYGHAPLDEGAGLDGCYATHVVLRSGTTVVPVPDTVPDALAASANCALATMVAATEPFRGDGTTAVIQGAGLLGLYACALLRAAGWRRIIVVDAVPARLEIVPALGGEPAVGTAAEAVPEGTADAVIEACGQASVIAEGVRLLRPGGHYAVAGLVHPAGNLDLSGETLVRKCLTIRGTHNYAPRHLEAAVQFLACQGAGLPADRLVSPPLPLAEIGAAFALAASGAWPRVAIRPDLPDAPVLSQS